jgi:hypothetical protein
LFLNPKLSGYLASGEIDFLIMHIFQTFLKARLGTLRIIDDHQRDIFRSQIIQALIDEKLLYPDKHYSLVSWEQPIYKYYAQEYLEEKHK